MTVKEMGWRSDTRAVSKVVEYIAQRGARQCGVSVSTEQKGKLGCSRHAPSNQGVRLYRTSEDVQMDQVTLLSGARLWPAGSGGESLETSKNDLPRLFCYRCSEPRDEKPVLITSRLSLRIVISDPIGRSISRHKDVGSGYELTPKHRNPTTGSAVHADALPITLASHNKLTRPTSPPPGPRMHQTPPREIPTPNRTRTHEGPPHHAESRRQAPQGACTGVC